MESNRDMKKLPDISDFHKNHKNIAKPDFRRNLLDYVQQYTDATGIHGFKYIGENRRQLVERIFWTISFGVSVFICTLLIIQTWEKWDTSPVLVSFSKTPTYIWKIPFPAVTLCPYTKSKQGMYNYTESFNKLMQNDTFTESELKNFTASSLICNNYMYSQGSRNVDLDVIDHLINIAPQISSLFIQCRWNLHVDNCAQSFTKVLTEDGLCFTSNMLRKEELLNDNVYLHYNMTNGTNSEGWSLENGYPDIANKDSFPRRAKFSGFTGSQVFVLKDYDQDLDYICKGPVQGFKIILHNPAELPRVNMNYLQASLDEELLIIITPEMMTTSKNVRKYNPHKRECFFPKERDLYFFRIYTQQNCEFECLTNYTLQKCGCVGFYMPFEKGTPICGPGSLKCMLEAQSELIKQTGDYSSDLKTNQSSLDVGGFSCDCLPACSSLTYNAEFSQAHFHWRKLIEAMRENETEFFGVHLSRLTIFFKDSQFISQERNELFGMVDFLANCGGIIGLFTGFSFLSLIEIVYFLSLRLVCNVKKYGKHQWSASSKLASDSEHTHS